MEYLSVKNFDQFQHYKDRNPPWIKFYVSVLDNYEYGCLQDASKAHLMGIWLLASKMDNRVPADPEWIAKRIQASGVVDLQVLAEQGFIELSSNALARCKQSAMPETETETETDICAVTRNADNGTPNASNAQKKKQKQNKLHVRFEEFRSAYPARDGGQNWKRAGELFTRNTEDGIDPQSMIDGAKRYAACMKRTDAWGTSKVKMASTFLGPDQHWQEDYTAPRKRPDDLELI